MQTAVALTKREGYAMLFIIMTLACGNPSEDVVERKPIHDPVRDARMSMVRSGSYDTVNYIDPDNLDQYRHRLEADHIVTMHTCYGRSFTENYGPSIEKGAEISMLDVVSFFQTEAQFGSACRETFQGGFMGCTDVVEYSHGSNMWFFVVYPDRPFFPGQCVEDYEAPEL